MIPMNRDLRRRLAAGALAGSLVAAPALILSPQVAALMERAGIERPSLATDASLAMLMMSKCAPLVGFEQGGGGPNIANLFATSTYNGNSATQTIANGVNLASGGMVWSKWRSGAGNHVLVDSVRGLSSELFSNLTNAANTSGSDYTSFNASGYSLGFNSGNSNLSGRDYVSWSFARAARFFDVVTYTGNATQRTIAHSLGVAPGMIILKRTDTTGDWRVLHRSLTGSNGLYLNLTEAQASYAADTFGDGAVVISPTSSVFTVGSHSSGNASGGTYVAYLFAHDTAADGVVQCGSFTTDGSQNATITLGWQPQWAIIKRTDGSEGWRIFDTARGWATGNDNMLFANASDAEGASQDFGAPNSTGFSFTGNFSSTSYVYLAIRAAA